MFKVSTEAYDHRKHSFDVMEVFPTKDCLDKIILLAKMADVVLYPGYSGSSFWLELPAESKDCEAMFELATELGLSWSEFVYTPHFD
jgi:hypothetical protein